MKTEKAVARSGEACRLPSRSGRLDRRVERARVLAASVVAFAAVWLAGCSSSPDGSSAAGKPTLGATDKGPASPIDHPPVGPGEAPIYSATPQRLAIAQLRKSFPAAFGQDENGDDITWRIGSAKGLDKMGDSLGEADYIDTTEDSLEPSPLYLKFMDDAARDVCNRVLVADAAKATQADRVLTREVTETDTMATAPASVDANLRYLVLRLYGIKLAADDAVSLADLETLFTAAVTASAGESEPAAKDVTEGWRAVCVAMLTAPEFHVY